MVKKEYKCYTNTYEVFKHEYIVENTYNIIKYISTCIKIHQKGACECTTWHHMVSYIYIYIYIYTHIIYKYIYTRIGSTMDKWTDEQARKRNRPAGHQAQKDKGKHKDR